MINFILKKLKKSGKPQKIYILPTLDGIKLLGLNFILLVIGLTYANNYILLFNFILFGLFLCSMFYTHFNLEGLQLEAIKTSPTHAGENGTLHLYFKSKSKLGHNFISVNIDSKLISLEKSFFSFEKSSDQELIAHLKFHTNTRGVEYINHIYLETLFPFHLFRCVSFHNCNLEVIAYPKINNNKLFSEIISPSDKNEESEELELRQFRHGDSLARVDWKRMTQTDRWYTKHLNSPALNPITLSFQENIDTFNNVEEQLSSIATYVRAFHSNGIPYGLSLIHHNKKISTVLPDNSHFHLQQCLKLMAQYEY